MTATVTIHAGHKRVRLVKINEQGDVEEVILLPQQIASVHVSAEQSIGDIIELDE